MSSDYLKPDYLYTIGPNAVRAAFGFPDLEISDADIQDIIEKPKEKRHRDKLSFGYPVLDIYANNPDDLANSEILVKAALLPDGEEARQHLRSEIFGALYGFMYYHELTQEGPAKLRDCVQKTIDLLENPLIKCAVIKSPYCIYRDDMWTDAKRQLEPLEAYIKQLRNYLAKPSDPLPRDAAKKYLFCALSLAYTHAFGEPPKMADYDNSAFSKFVEIVADKMSKPCTEGMANWLINHPEAAEQLDLSRGEPVKQFIRKAKKTAFWKSVESSLEFRAHIGEDM